MKLNKKQIKELISKTIKSYLSEAEDEPAADNPFAAAAKEDPAAEDEKKDEKKPEAEEPAGVKIKFNLPAVKRYNDKPFVSDTGVVKSINKDGIIVTTQPDQVDVLVNFDDISENIKRFFKGKKK